MTNNTFKNFEHILEKKINIKKIIFLCNDINEMSYNKLKIFLNEACLNFIKIRYHKSHL